MGTDAVYHKLDLARVHACRGIGRRAEDQVPRQKAGRIHQALTGTIRLCPVHPGQAAGGGEFDLEQRPLGLRRLEPAAAPLVQGDQFLCLRPGAIRRGQGHAEMGVGRPAGEFHREPRLADALEVGTREDPDGLFDVPAFLVQDPVLDPERAVGHGDLAGGLAVRRLGPGDDVLPAPQRRVQAVAGEGIREKQFAQVRSRFGRPSAPPLSEPLPEPQLRPAGQEDQQYRPTQDRHTGQATWGKGASPHRAKQPRRPPRADAGQVIPQLDGAGIAVGLVGRRGAEQDLVQVLSELFLRCRVGGEGGETGELSRGKAGQQRVQGHAQAVHIGGGAAEIPGGCIAQGAALGAAPGPIGDQAGVGQFPALAHADHVFRLDVAVHQGLGSRVQVRHRLRQPEADFEGLLRRKTPAPCQLRSQGVWPIAFGGSDAPGHAPRRGAGRTGLGQRNGRRAGVRVGQFHDVPKPGLVRAFAHLEHIHQPFVIVRHRLEAAHAGQFLFHKHRLVGGGRPDKLHRPPGAQHPVTRQPDLAVGTGADGVQQVVVGNGAGGLGKLQVHGPFMSQRWKCQHPRPEEASKNPPGKVRALMSPPSELPAERQCPGGTASEGNLQRLTGLAVGRAMADLRGASSGTPQRRESRTPTGAS